MINRRIIFTEIRMKNVFALLNCAPNDNDSRNPRDRAFPEELSAILQVGIIVIELGIQYCIDLFVHGLFSVRIVVLILLPGTRKHCEFQIKLIQANIDTTRLIEMPKSGRMPNSFM